MIKVVPTFDAHLIDTMIRLPYIWSEITDDSCPKDPGVLDIPFIVKECVNLAVIHENEHGFDTLGVYILVPKNPSTIEAHTLLTDRCRGAMAVEAGHRAMEWIWENTPYTEITSFTWSDRPHVAWYMNTLGFHKNSEEDWPQTRDGKKVKIWRYSISKS
jgi:hypothetical protein